MKYVLRLFIVLVLVCGIGFLTYFLIRDNSNFNVNAYSNQVFEENKAVYEKIEDLYSSVNSQFTENKVIYDDFKQSLNFLNSYLINAKISKTERSNIKNVFENFKKEFKTLETSVNSLDEYLKEENKNENELLGRKERATNDFVKLNKSFYNLNNTIENIVSKKFFNGTFLDASFAINSCKNVLSKSYLETKNKYSLVSSVISKNNSLKGNNYRVNESAVKFAIKYNNMQSSVVADFNSYFATDKVNDNVNTLLSFLESEGYYEKD